MIVRGFKTRCENISLQMRKDLGLEKNDPLLPWPLAEHLGVSLWKPSDIQGLTKTSYALLTGTERNSWSALAISLNGMEAIIYNSTHSEARQSSDIMHELSHILLKHEPSKMVLFYDGSVVLRSYNEAQENEASWLSGCLLLPREVLVFMKRVGMSTNDACRKYKVSSTLLDYRMNLAGVNHQFQS